jgi:chromosome segregation ATPase
MSDKVKNNAVDPQNENQTQTPQEGEQTKEELEKAKKESERLEREARELEDEADKAEEELLYPADYVRKLRQEAAEKRIKAKELQNKVKELEAQLNSYKEKAEKAEEALNKLLEAELKQIPEQYRDLIPEGLTPAEKLSWIAKAKEKGLFKPIPSVGSEMPSSTTQQYDLSKMTVSEMMKLARENPELYKQLTQELRR